LRLTPSTLFLLHQCDTVKTDRWLRTCFFFFESFRK
jgi:hypothetical protein